jgi:NADPH2:quinone reductase
VRALVITRNGGPDVLELRDEPEPEARPGALVVALEAAGVNFRDVYEREGRGAYANDPPLICGAEGAGRVVEVGEGVDEFAVGDRVAWARRRQRRREGPRPCARRGGRSRTA